MALRKLTAEAVTEIREAVRLRDELRQRASRLTNAQLAKRYGVHQRTVDKVVDGTTWAKLP